MWKYLLSINVLSHSKTVRTCIRLLIATVIEVGISAVFAWIGYILGIESGICLTSVAVASIVCGAQLIFNLGTTYGMRRDMKFLQRIGMLPKEKEA